MGNAARKARKKSGEKFEREEKRPTRPYLTKEQRQQKRRDAKRIDEKIAGLAAKVARSQNGGLK